MDPLTALLVAALFADLLSGGWVHSTLIGGAAGAGREAWRDLAPRIPPSVAKSRTARAAAATGRGLWYGGGAVVRGTRAGFAPGVRAGHERWRERRHWWHRAAELGGRLRLWVRGRQERPVEGSAPTSAGPGPGHPSPPGGGPGGGRPGVVGPRSPTTTGTTTTGTTTTGTTTTGSPGAGGGGATAPAAVPQPVAATTTTATGERPPLTLITGGATTTEGKRLTWRTATTLTDLTRLTEGWLRGEVRSQPGYLGPVDVDEHDAPGITAALIAANRAGYLTHNSQAGFDGPGRGRAARMHFRQIAWVSGRARPDVADRLATAARAAGFHAQFMDRGCPPLPVTWVDGKPYTVDRHDPPTQFGRLHYPGIGAGARAELVAARPLAITDPVPGRNTLWPWLERTCNALTSTTPSANVPSTTTTEEDPTVSATTVDVTTPNTSTEDVPAHIAAGLDLADAIEDIAEQYTSALEDTVRRHIESAESIPGFPPSLQGDWEDGVMQPLNMISTLLAQAAEAARGAAEAERKALEQSVEAADNAPSDSDLPQSVLRTN